MDGHDRLLHLPANAIDNNSLATVAMADHGATTAEAV